MRYAYFPGCSLHSTARDYEESARAVAGALGIELIEIPKWTCCGSTPAHLTDDLLSVALPVRNLLLAKEISQEMVVCCAACYSRFKFANKYVREKEGLREDVKEILGVDYKGEVKVRHLLDVLLNSVGVENIKRQVKRRLGGLKVASYYGCLLTRPPKVVEFDDPEAPSSMDELMVALGGEPITWHYKTECCGAAFSLTKTDVLIRLCHDIFQNAKAHGAECVIVACPLCHMNLDMREMDIEKNYGIKIQLPIFYFTQLVGLALGIDRKKLGLRRSMVSSRALLEEKGLLVC